MIELGNQIKDHLKALENLKLDFYRYANNKKITKTLSSICFILNLTLVRCLQISGEAKAKLKKSVEFVPKRKILF